MNHRSPAKKRWICGTPITRRLDPNETEIAFDEAVTAWRFIRHDAGGNKGRERKTRISGPEPVFVSAAKDAQRATRAQVFALDNGTTSFSCSTRYGQEWYFMSPDLIPEIPSSLEKAS